MKHPEMTLPIRHPVYEAILAGQRGEHVDVWMLRARVARFGDGVEQLAEIAGTSEHPAGLAVVELNRRSGVVIDLIEAGQIELAADSFLAALDDIYPGWRDARSS
jgi:hypothetical protein